MRLTPLLPLLLLLASPAVAGELWPEVLGPVPVTGPPAPLPSLSAQTCNGCHAAIHDQWAASGHATAATNPVYVEAVRALGAPPLCQECHLPLMVQRADLPKGPGALGKSARQPNPAWNPTLASEGVTCSACHVRGDVIVGPRELAAERAPHPVRREPALQTAAACTFCHQAALPGAEDHPFLDTVGEWSRSHFPEAGIGCRDCHMTRVSGTIAGSRYASFASHGMLEGRAPSAIARALTLELSVRAPHVQRGDAVRATANLMNTGAGHAVPTGDPSHALELRFRVLDPGGVVAEAGDATSFWLERIVEAAPPFAEVSDSRLPAAGSRVFDYAWTASKKLQPGVYTLVVSTHWWAVRQERAEAVGLTADAVRVDVAEQRVQIRVD